MNEIERAIEMIKDVETFYLGNGIMDDESVELLRTITLTVLRAELARQDAKPLTCDGCEFDRRDNIVMAFTRCENCVRQERTYLSDRYEPKGEKA